MKLKILCISHSSNFFGAEQSFLFFLQHLDKKKFEPIVVLPDSKGLLADKVKDLKYKLHIIAAHSWISSEDMHQVAQNTLDEFALIRKYAEVIEEEEIDVVYTNTITRLAGAIAAKSSGVPHVWHIREVLENHPLKSIFGQETAFSLVNYLSDRIIANSCAVAQQFPSAASPSKVNVVHNAIDTEAFACGDGGKLRRELFVDPDCSLVGIIGQIHKHKNHEDLVRAFRFVADRRIKSKLIIIGEEETEYKKFLLELISQLHLEEYVIFIGFREDMPDVFKSLNLVVVASLAEPFGRTTIEAMAAGKPVIATNTGASPEIVLDGVTGLLVPPGAPEKMADAIFKVLGNATLAKEMGEAGRQRVQTEFTTAKYIAGIETVLTEAYNGSKKKGSQRGNEGATLLGILNVLKPDQVVTLFEKAAEHGTIRELILEERTQWAQATVEDVKQRDTVVLSQQKQLETLQAELSLKEQHLKTLEIHLEEFHRSISWRITKPLRIVYEKIRSLVSAPGGVDSTHSCAQQETLLQTHMGFRMTLFLQFVLQLLLHPISTIRATNRDTVRLAFGYMKNGDINGLLKGMGYFLGRSSQSTEFKPVILHGTISPHTPLCLPRCDAPVVSIIIPVHNQWEFTHSCLASIIEESGDVPYEVIIADDVSTDQTIDIEQQVKNITVVRNSKNLGFLRNCNNAAISARGKYLLFLNNDTNVQPGWLLPLVTLMDADKRIGIAGSKLVYPDGMLQEAGGIIWSDASGWNFGWRDDPEKPGYNYVKEVDYVSGASIMVRRDLWEKVGGFDERYAPAYFEDTDLAFQARSLGYRVIYQPKSVVVHFEGVSHGKNVATGIKAYQEVNKSKFLQRWQEVLVRDHFANGQNVFEARDRSRHNKTVLVIDHYVPMYDKDAGSFFMYSLLKALVALDYKVIFWPDNLYSHQPYTSVLQQMGVEVIIGPHNLNDYLEEYGSFFDAAILTRNHISIKYIDTVRRHITRVMYHDPDLEFVREGRRFEQEGGNAAALAEIKEREFYLFRNCDVIGIHSPVERDIILKELPDAHVEVIPLPVNDVEASQATYEKRTGLLFVGGTHPPNVDALRYFIQQILPPLSIEIPGIRLTVAGEVSHHELKGLDLSLVDFTGYVSDLRPLFEKALVYVAPLRFGAGIKGKIIEAANYGIPVVTTSVGAEGIGLVDKESIMIADTHTDFALAVSELHSNQQLWESIRDKAREFVTCNFSQTAFQGKVGRIMSELCDGTASRSDAAP
ncbi:glycosyltransferase [Geomonas terrae]|nr:glycosyltransferase [Geomonas terrae]